MSADFRFVDADRCKAVYGVTELYREQIAAARWPTPAATPSPPCSGWLRCCAPASPTSTPRSTLPRSTALRGRATSRSPT
ncbi:hypothetical protein ACLQ18_01565 [Streptomyces sp. DT193]|uniref:hypothetical protein n=1 Tax=Streptomyces sp. DT193 TaxID=3393418 RepID=UPI003CEF1C38